MQQDVKLRSASVCACPFGGKKLGRGWGHFVNFSIFTCLDTYAEAGRRWELLRSIINLFLNLQPSECPYRGVVTVRQMGRIIYKER